MCFCEVSFGVNASSCSSMEHGAIVLSSHGNVRRASHGVGRQGFYLAAAVVLVVVLVVVVVVVLVE